MTKQYESVANENYTTLAAVGVIALIVGVIIGQMVMPAQPVVENKTEVFAQDMQKINETKGIFEKYYYLQTGEQITLEYISAEDLGSLILLTYKTPDGSPLKIYTTKDYKYLIPSAALTEDLKKSVEKAIQELASIQENETKEIPKSDSPKVELFIMSFCPYGNIAEQAFNSVVDTLGDAFMLEPVYIIYDETVSPYYNAKNTEYCMVDEQNVTYCSLHGINELKQGIREIIVYKLYGVGIWADYVDAVDRQCSLQDIENCWKTTAEGMNLSVSDIETYYNEHLYEILADQKEKTFSSKKFGSPSIVINGKDYNGGRTPEAFKIAICNAFITSPETCNVTLSQSESAASGSCG